MSVSVRQYIDAVLEHLAVEERYKRRIADDLMAQIEEAAKYESLDAVLARMGAPEQVAAEFMDSMLPDKDAVIDRLIRERARLLRMIPRIYEFRTHAEWFGLPLIHIKFRRGRYSAPCVARGVIAIGDVAVGAVALGGLAFGGFAFGGLAAGVVALAGIALGGLSLGGIAVGLGAVGGVAVGQIAIGGVAVGVAAIGGEARGRYIIEVGRHGVVQIARGQVQALIQRAFPEIPGWVSNLLSWPFGR